MPSSCRLTAAVLSSLLVAGCTSTPSAGPPQAPFSNLGPKEVPDFLQGTIWQQTDVANIAPQRVSGYGLVVNLDGTGDTKAPGPVREYMNKLMQKRGFGSGMAGMNPVAPERVLNDPDKRTAIVRVDGFIPPGAHAGQPFDVSVSALDNSDTTSLQHGELYQTDLAPRGADPFNPGGGVTNPWAQALNGPIAINPAYALGDGEISRNQKLSMRFGIVMNRGVVVEERPLVLKLRQPERRLAKLIETRINERFQGANDERFRPDNEADKFSGDDYFRARRPVDVDAGHRTNAGSRTAVAKNESEIYLYVPYRFGDDWERFIGVVMHSYFNGNSDYGTVKAQKLAELAVKADDKLDLLAVSYCWEAIGTPAIPALTKLYSNPNPRIAFAAARAGAFVGDLVAQQTLARMAATNDHPFQITSIEVLGALPSTAQLRTTIRGLLDSGPLLVRVAAYKAMLASGDPVVVSKRLHNRFTLDLVGGDGPPVVYATRVGEPRIALIGRPARIQPPAVLMAMNNRLTVLSDAQKKGVQIFYRDPYGQAVTQDCLDDLAVVIGRLGGETPDPAERLRFQYSDVVGIVQKIVDGKMLTSVGADGGALATTFQIQSLPGVDDVILSAPSLPDQRPTDPPTTNVAAR